MTEETPVDRFRENVTSIVSMAVTGIWIAGLVTGQGWWLAALLIGYIVVVPVTAILAGDDEEESFADGMPGHQTAAEETEDETDPLETLRDRYARGELTEEQFERKLERLLETETREDAAEHARSRPSVEREPDADSETELSRE